MHSTIFQITKTRVEKENYLNEDTLMQGDNSHFAQPLIHLLQVVVQRSVVVVWEAVLRDDAGVGGRPDIERVGFPVVPDIQDFTARKLERGDFLPRHGGELLRHHIFGHRFYIVAGSVGAVTPDVVAYFLLRVLQHDLVGCPFSCSSFSHISGRASFRLVCATLNTLNTCIFG